MGKTQITWADHVWNTVSGCTHITEGCDHCYHQQLADGKTAGWGRSRSRLLMVL